jgi:hypothetical protein
MKVRRLVRIPRIIGRYRLKANGWRRRTPHSSTLTSPGIEYRERAADVLPQRVHIGIHEADILQGKNPWAKKPGGE